MKSQRIREEYNNNIHEDDDEQAELFDACNIKLR